MADFVICIVPPTSAIATAKRIVDASLSLEFSNRKTPLHYLDLNAISPRTAREIDGLFSESSGNIKFIDGGIIGGPPSLKDDGTWSKPSIPVSGPHQLSEVQPNGEHLASTLNIKHINDTIGSATGLKMCYASLSKGFTALAIQSYTTAQNLGVIDELRAHLDDGIRARAERGLVSMPPKAYRWIGEMMEIAATFEEDGGFNAAESPLRGIAGVYDLVSNGTELGKEKTEDRQRGKTADDVAKLMAEGTARRKRKMD